MHKLIEGYRRFRAEIFPGMRDHFHLLAESQSPQFLFITCCDSRVVPDLIFQTEPGDMFLCRNVGNVVPPAGELGRGGTSATIEYAVEVLKVPHIIICGHSDCGAVRAAMQPELARHLPLVRPWLHYVEEAQAAGTRALPSTCNSDAELRECVHANVVGQLANLRTHASVARALAAHTLQIHGWYYDILSGAVEAYAPDQRAFVPLESTTATQ